MIDLLVFSSAKCIACFNSLVQESNYEFSRLTVCEWTRPTLALPCLSLKEPVRELFIAHEYRKSFPVANFPISVSVLVTVHMQTAQLLPGNTFLPSLLHRYKSDKLLTVLEYTSLSSSPS